ncbi:MAG: enoyl-CoA hydratase/isomerase family protein [Alphaproteobacteria bacterium]|nr:enoyl-CoA hydratase/isomerase family protein [Alphaproteobacteria bacterium]
MTVVEADFAQREEDKRALLAAGMEGARTQAWIAARPATVSGFEADRHAYSRYWELGRELLESLPRPPARNEIQRRAAARLLQGGRETRQRFMAAHALDVYRALTDDLRAFVRVERLVVEAARLVPGLCPTADQVAAEAQHKQGEKDGIEIDQGIFCHAVLARPDTGMHLCHAMLLPRVEARQRLAELEATGKVDLKFAEVERIGKASYVTLKNPRYLNAEDDSTMDPLEIAVDLALLDPATQVCVMRGGHVEHPKYKGRRIFQAGINLTHIYYGKIPYMWYVRRDLGWVNKVMRGHALETISPDEVTGETHEKLWIAQVDTFAIGGGCQALLVTDYNIAGADSYMTLPARKEGIIPGMANLRMWRFTGDRITRQAIMYERGIPSDSEAGRMIIDKIVPTEQTDAAVAEAVEGLTSSGVVSARGNRVAIRTGQEPFDLFRRYAAVYAREQAWCHFSPALIANLERHWNAAQRKM